jgi:phosphatidylinositol phospholipase C, delta
LASQNGDTCPIVKHGFTITSSVTFQEVVEAIAKFAQLHPAHTPIILSLENHASAGQQQQMAAILNSHFGKKLLLAKENTIYYPKLQDLLGRVIIKNSGTFEHFKKAGVDCDEAF